jgi:hypothetical protein
LVVAAVAASMAVVLTVLGLTLGGTRPPATQADVYTRLAQQLKRHLLPLVPGKATTKRAPSIPVPPAQGYTCEVKQPAVRSCSQTSTATPRAIPVVAP